MVTMNSTLNLLLCVTLLATTTLSAGEMCQDWCLSFSEYKLEMFGQTMDMTNEMAETFPCDPPAECIDGGVSNQGYVRVAMTTYHNL